MAGERVQAYFALQTRVRRPLLFQERKLKSAGGKGADVEAEAPPVPMWQSLMHLAEKGNIGVGASIFEVKGGVKAAVITPKQADELAAELLSNAAV